MERDSDIAQAKRRLRAEMRRLRTALGPTEVERASRMIWRRLRRLPEWREARIVHTYVGALPGEVRTDALVASCLKTGRRVIVPVVGERGTMRGMWLAHLDDLRPTPWGGREPVNAEHADPNTADVIIVPGVAFDRKGNRLGMGGGYYDRFLSGTAACKIGLAHSLQIVDAVPGDESDASVNLIVTPDEVIRPG